MKLIGILAVTVMAAAVVVVLIAMPTALAITCGEVESQLAPCMPYLIGGGDPTTPCCDGVKSLRAMMGSTEDKQAACNCAKDAASRHQEIKDDLASELAAKCGVELGVPISRNIDCAS
ncbi:hypothetical protein U1Q18_026666 [Sarracenia purpurea var. burkii]